MEANKMRRIEHDIIQAVRNKTELHIGTSSSYVSSSDFYRDTLHFNKDTFSYRLWGNEIATGDVSAQKITVSDCGYPTATTVSRLNALFAGLDIPMAASVKKGKVIYKIHGVLVTPGMLSYIANDWYVTIK